MDDILTEEGSPTGSARPVVSIVVIGWGEAPHLLDCLRSIELVDASISREVIVTLNEPTADLLTTLSARVASMPGYSRPGSIVVSVVHPMRP